MNTLNPWKEIYDFGSQKAEEEAFHRLGFEMLAIQEQNRARSGNTVPNRTLHAKIVAGLTAAALVVDQDLPPEFAAGWFQPGTRHSVAVRFSNASGIPMPDSTPDMRGVALRVALPDGGSHDLLMTNFPVSHARDARQFVDFAVIAAAGDRSTMLERLNEKFGEAETLRMLANLKQGVRPCSSMALESFWSRGAVLWAGRPTRFQLRAVAHDEAPIASSDQDVHALRTEFAGRLARGEVRYRLAVQRFIDETLTPIEDGSMEWKEDVSPPVEVATLVIPGLNSATEFDAQLAAVDALAFNPWNAPAEFRPLGNLNRARGVVYRMSAEHWQVKPHA